MNMRLLTHTHIHRSPHHRYIVIPTTLWDLEPRHITPLLNTFIYHPYNIRCVCERERHVSYTAQYIHIPSIQHRVCVCVCETCLLYCSIHSYTIHTTSTFISIHHQYTFISSLLSTTFISIHHQYTFNIHSYPIHSYQSINQSIKVYSQP